MTETPQGAGNPPPEANMQETTDPAPAVPNTPSVDATESAPRTAESGARWHWPSKTRNRIAASVAVAAGALAIAAAVFAGGVAAGAHTVEYGAGQHPDRYSAASAQREGAPMEQIWIVPAGPTPAGSEGLVITGTESASMASPN